MNFLNNLVSPKKNLAKITWEEFKENLTSLSIIMSAFETGSLDLKKIQTTLEYLEQMLGDEDFAAMAKPKKKTKLESENS